MVGIVQEDNLQLGSKRMRERVKIVYEQFYD